MSINSGMAKQNDIFVNGIRIHNENEQAADHQYNLNKSQKYSDVWQKAHTKLTVYDSCKIQKQ